MLLSISVSNSRGGIGLETLLHFVTRAGNLPHATQVKLMREQLLPFLTRCLAAPLSNLSAYVTINEEIKYARGRLKSFMAKMPFAPPVSPYLNQFVRDPENKVRWKITDPGSNKRGLRCECNICLCLFWMCSRLGTTGGKMRNTKNSSIYNSYWRQAWTLQIVRILLLNQKWTPE